MPELPVEVRGYVKVRAMVEPSEFSRHKDLHDSASKRTVMLCPGGPRGTENNLADAVGAAPYRSVMFGKSLHSKLSGAQAYLS